MAYPRFQYGLPIQNPTSVRSSVTSRSPVTPTSMSSAFRMANGYISFEFFPSVQDKLVTAQLEMPAGTTPERTERITAWLQETGHEAIDELEEEAVQELVENVYVTVGQQPRATSGPNQAGFTATSANIAEVSFEMIDPEERSVTSTQFEDRWRERTGAVPSA